MSERWQWLAITTRRLDKAGSVSPSVPKVDTKTGRGNGRVLSFGSKSKMVDARVVKGVLNPFVPGWCGFCMPVVESRWHEKAQVATTPSG
ncbi:hypothetical protein CPB86DRAFT_778052 [Serendipita vermifera]|nr:hypothetical protein CPB86DRAFT_778052 [Serendipita vermifera]